MFSVFALFLTMQMTTHVGPMTSGTPAVEPHMAVNGSTVALTFGAGHVIYSDVSHDSGRTFSGPVKVAEAPILPLSMHRGPRIAFTEDAIVITAVVGKIDAHEYGKPADGNLMAWRSTDGGKTWSKGVAINDVPAAPSEGLPALASNGKQKLFAAWLDHRISPGTTLYGSESSDGGRTWSKNVLIYKSPGGSICTCCAPSVAFDANGDILVMFRNWLDDDRDMYLTRSRDGVNFSKPEKLGEGTWKINACPMDGGGLAMYQDHSVTAWRREGDVFLDEPGEAETRIATGKDIALSAGAGGVYAIWSSPSGVQALIPGKSEPVALAPAGSFPNIVALPSSGAVAAWEHDGQITIRPIP